VLVGVRGANVNRDLHAILTRATVIQGAQDKLVLPRCRRQLAAALPRARLEMVSGGHMAPYIHPAAIAAAVKAVSGRGVRE
jgi:pimeloyl-ACP methyl ester carboxylesterase